MDHNQVMCGLDLRDGISPAKNYTGLYSTQVFTTKAVEVIKEHATSNNEKVTVVEVKQYRRSVVSASPYGRNDISLPKLSVSTIFVSQLKAFI